MTVPTEALLGVSKAKAREIMEEALRKLRGKGKVEMPPPKAK